MSDFVDSLVSNKGCLILSEKRMRRWDRRKVEETGGEEGVRMDIDMQNEQRLH